MDSISGRVKSKIMQLFFLYFSAKHTLLMITSKEWLVRNQNNASKWNDMCIRRLLFQWASTIQFQLRVLVNYKADIIIIMTKM